MTPLFFGEQQRRLFGIYEPPHVRSGTARAAVICHPWGDEHIHAYRSLRQLASQLSHAGFHVLRFDYYGTGDSGGESGAGDLESWRKDIESAITELKDITGARRVTLVGLRLGGTLTAMAAASCPEEVESIVLWDPLVVGDGLASLTGITSGHAELPVSERLAHDLEVLDLGDLFCKLPARTLAVLTNPDAKIDDLYPLTVETIDGPLAWSEERVTSGSIPVAALRRIVQWLE